MRKNMMQELAPITEKARTDAPNFPLATYQGVIANLKEREKDLRLQLATQSSNLGKLENLSNTVLENIPTGVLMFSPNLLVQQANAAGRALLGYASPLNMHVKEVFRGLQTVELPSSNGALGGIGQAIRDVFVKAAEYRAVPASYSTPAGELRAFRISLLPLSGTGPQVIGALCLIESSDTAFTLSFPPAEAGKKAGHPE
jgi:PAS domain-containing protein